AENVTGSRGHSFYATPHLVRIRDSLNDTPDGKRQQTTGDDAKKQLTVRLAADSHNDALSIRRPTLRSYGELQCKQADEEVKHTNSGIAKSRDELQRGAARHVIPGLRRSIRGSRHGPCHSATNC